VLFQRMPEDLKISTTEIPTTIITILTITKA
jgi:hypothetical protein